MDRTDQIITLLQALVSSGGIAEDIQQQVATAQESLSSNRAVTGQVALNAERFVNIVIADTVRDILGSGGDLTMIGDKIDKAYSVGLMSGLAIGATLRN